MPNSTNNGGKNTKRRRCMVWEGYGQCFNMREHSNADFPSSCSLFYSIQHSHIRRIRGKKLLSILQHKRVTRWHTQEWEILYLSTIFLRSPECFFPSLQFDSSFHHIRCHFSRIASYIYRCHINPNGWMVVGKGAGVVNGKSEEQCGKCFELHKETRKGIRRANRTYIVKQIPFCMKNAETRQK